MPGFQQFTFDESVKSTPRDTTAIHVREGDYLLETVAVEPSSEDRDPYFLIKLKIVAGPEGIGKMLAYFAHFREATGAKKSTFFNLGNFVSSALSPERAAAMLAFLAPDASANPPKKGVSIDTYPKFCGLARTLEEKVKGAQVYGLVADAVRNGNTISQIDQVGPPSKYVATATLPPAAVVDLGPAPSVPATAAPASGPLPAANAAVVTEALMADIDNMFSGITAV